MTQHDVGLDIMNQDGYQPAAVDQVPVRVGARHPLGGRQAVDGLTLAEMGAAFGAMGAERGVMTALMNDLHVAATQANLQLVPIIGKRFQALQRSRLNRLLQEIRSTRGIQLPPSGFRALLNGATPTGPEYIEKQQVLNFIAEAMAELPLTE